MAFVKAWLDQPQLCSSNYYHLLFKPTIRYSTFVVIFNTSFLIKHLYRLTNRYYHAFTNAVTLAVTKRPSPMTTNQNRLKALMLDDHKLFRDGLRVCFQNHLNVDFEEFGSGDSLLNRVTQASELNHHLDFICTDINHPDVNGIDVIDKIRNLSDDILYHNGLRLRHIPIVVITMVSDEDFKERVRKIDKDIIWITKDADGGHIIKNIVKSVANYRKNIVEDFINEGYSLQFEEGKYKINRTYELPPFIETKYFAGIADLASKATTRKIVVHNSSSIGKISLSLFEDLLNDNKTTERELHEFFRMFPEFILDSSFDILHSENVFSCYDSKLRTDIVAQPRGQIASPSNWALVELKKHTEKLLTDKKYHANFTKAVFNAITQLRNYQAYFHDPANVEEISQKYYGIVPDPKLSLIIGKAPEGKEKLFQKMRSQYPDITITTYDEVLKFRKIQVQFMESLGV